MVDSTIDNENSERRQHERVSIEKSIYVEVLGRKKKSEAENTIIRCHTADISVAGLRLWIPEFVAVGSKLNIAVPMDDWKDNLELEGEIKWVKESEDNAGYWVGLELEESYKDAMEVWYWVVHRMHG